MPYARQATGAEHLKKSHHRIGKALNHICLPGGGADIRTIPFTHTHTDTFLERFAPSFQETPKFI
jgi:hypothetical protein